MKTRSSSPRHVKGPLHCRGAEAGLKRAIAMIPRELPPLTGLPIQVRSSPCLWVYRERLQTAGGGGCEVNAASSIRERMILVRRDLVPEGSRLKRVLIHEVFHFVWVHRSNAERWEFEAVLREEGKASIRGDLGWSAHLRKESLRESDRRTRSRRWREYVCESFCDTCAWWLAGRPDDDETTMARGRRGGRIGWCRNFFRPGRRIAL